MRQDKNSQKSALRYWRAGASFFYLKNCAENPYQLPEIIWRFVTDFLILLNHAVKRVEVLVQESGHFQNVFWRAELRVLNGVYI